MTFTLAMLPKEAKAMPPEAQKVFLDAYNRDFGWRCSEAHAEKAAWLAVAARWPELLPKE
jgi:ChaB protein